MKKRIISLILVLVMLCFVFASCDSPSIANEKIASYASLKNKEDFEAALKALFVDDGEFSTDDGTRVNETWDSIYSDLASVLTKDGDKLTAGTPSKNAVVYYNYRYTYTETNAETGVSTTFYFNDNMKSDKSVSVMLGLRDLTDLEKQLKDVLTATKIDDYVYSTSTTGKSRENDVVYVSYKYTETVVVGTDEATGNPITETKPSVTVTCERIELKKGVSAFADYLIDKDINKTTIENFEDPVTKTKYEGIKIDFLASGNEICTAKEVTYTEKNEATDIYGKKHDLKDRELTYYVYPVNYVEVPEFNAESFVNVILDDSITYQAVTRVLFGEYFEDQSEEAMNAILDLYKTTSEEKLGTGEKDLTLNALVEKLDLAQTEYASKLEAKEKAETDYNNKKTALELAKKNYDAKPDDAELKTKYETAVSNETAAATTLTNATNAFAAAEITRNYYVNSLITVTEANKKDGERFNLTDGYYWLTFEYLRDNYNEEIKAKFAKEVYTLFNDTYVEVKGLPEKVVKTTVDTIVDNKKYEFYNGTYDTTTKESNYAHFKGNFKEYLKAKVPNSNGSYDFAMRSIQQEAEGYVKEVVIIYAISEAYGLLVSDKDFKAYMKDENNSYDANAAYYGENNVRYAYQFDVIMKELLTYEEVDGAYVYKYLNANNLKAK